MYGHLLRRGIQAAAEHFSKGEQLEWQANEFARNYPRYQMPPWGVGIVAITTIGFVLLALSLEYTIRLVMVNLAVIESPSSAIVKVYTPLSSDCEDKKEGEGIEIEETHVVSEKPITNSIRRTMKHLTRQGGSSARWRGLPIFLVYMLVMGAFQLAVMPLRTHHRLSVLSRVSPASIISFLIADLGAALMAARIHCAWTHATITTGFKRYSDRCVSRVQWKQLLPVTALKVVVQELVVLTMVVTMQIGSKLIERTASDGCRAAIAIAPMVISVLLWIFVVLPVNIILVRKEASMLPESEETLVHFDRTFGNRIIPGLNNLSIRDAWASVTGEVWARVVKIHLKWVLIVFILAMLYFHVALLEVWAIMGDALPMLLASAKARLQTMAM